MDLAGEMQRKHRRAQPVPRGNPTIQRGLHYIGLVPKLLAKRRIQPRGYQEPGGPEVNGRWRETIEHGADVDAEPGHPTRRPGCTLHHGLGPANRVHVDPATHHLADGLVIMPSTRTSHDGRWHVEL